MASPGARSPRDGSKIDLQSLHARYNQVAQIAQCLRVSIESQTESVEPAAVCRAIVDLLDDINSDLWTFLEPAHHQKIEAKAAARQAGMLRRRADAGQHHEGCTPGANGTGGAINEDATH